MLVIFNNLNNTDMNRHFLNKGEHRLRHPDRQGFFKLKKKGKRCILRSSCIRHGYAIYIGMD